MKIETDKIQHFSVCGVAALLSAILIALLGVPYVPTAFSAFLVGLALGVGKEYGDHVSPVNSWDWGDLLADILGSYCGALIGALTTLIN